MLARRARLLASVLQALAQVKVASARQSWRRKGSLGLVLDSDAAEEAASDNGAAAAPAPADAVDDARDALFTVKTALVEMRTRSSLVSDSCDSDDVRAPL